MPTYFYILFFIAGLIWNIASFTPKDFYKKLNKFIIYIPLPAITITKIPALNVIGNLENTLPPIIAVWSQLIVSVVIMICLGKIFKWDKSTTGAMALVCGLSNTSFIGFPLVETYFGADAVKYAVIVDQGGSFFCLSTLGIIVATVFSSGKVNVYNMVKNLISFPPFILFLIAIINPKDILHNDWYMEYIYPYLVDIGKLMVPLAIISIGMQFKFSLEGVDKKAFTVGLFYKLLLFPAIVYFIMHIYLGKTDIQNDITVFEIAMPSMITASIVALNYNLNPKLSNALVTLGILFAMPTLYIWHYILS